jgi:hypothetical protein
MKKRTSTAKAEWNDKREGWYRGESLKLAFNMGLNLVERDHKVYLIRLGQEELFCEPMKKKSIWFETWSRLKRMGEPT